MEVRAIVFCVVAQCGLIERYQHFGVTFCLHLQGRRVVLNLEATGSSETVESFYQTTWRQISKVQSPHPYLFNYHCLT